MNIAISKPKLGKDSKAFLAKKHHMLIDGKWVEAKSGKTFEVEDPATQEIIAHVPAGDKADIDLAVKAARLPPRFILMTIPSKDWMRSFSPSTTLTWRRSVSPTRNAGRSLRNSRSSIFWMVAFMGNDSLKWSERAYRNGCADSIVLG